MKTFIGLSLHILFFISYTVQAQDTTFIQMSDTLHQTGNSEKNDPEYYNWRGANPDEASSSAFKSKQNYLKKPVFRLAINGGLGYRIGKTPEGNSELKGFINDSRLGGRFGIDLHFFLQRKLALGIEYYFFNPKNSGTVDNVYIKDNTKIQYVGPSFAARIPTSFRRNAFIFSYSIGYGSFKEVTEEKNNKATLTGGCLASTISFGYDFALSDRLALGFKMSILVGNIHDFTYKDSSRGTTKYTLDVEEGENISSVNLSVGLRIVR